MGRYSNSKIKKSNVVRGLDNPNPYNDVVSYRTTIYSSIPESDKDIWVIAQPGDRLDLLASQYYGNVSLWWYIAKANNITSNHIPGGTSLRIPGTIKYAIGR